MSDEELIERRSINFSHISRLTIDDEKDNLKNSIIMINTYIKTGWRNIRKNGFHSFLNIFGLALGLAFTLLIAAFVWSELSINKSLRNASRQYIIQSKWKDPNMGYDLATLGPLARALKEEYPSLVANYYRFDGITSTVSKGDKVFREVIQVGDPGLLSMYGFKLVEGNASSALNEPFSVVLTASMARKYFGRADVLGETLMIENFSGEKHSFMIKAIIKDPPENSVTHLNKANDSQAFLSISDTSFFKRPIDSWARANIVEFIELKLGVTAKDVQKPMQDLIRRNASSQVSANLTPYLVPLTDYYLQKDNGLVKKMLYIVSIIALFILLMAVINFINISIGGSANRIKEVGVRKLLGGMRSQLIIQFLAESTLVVFFATVVALMVYNFASPLLSEIVGKKIPQLSSFPGSFIIIPLLLTILIGLLAGWYPSLIYSGLQPADSLKGKLKSVNENILFRKSLIGLQFFTACIVFTGAVVVSKQTSLFFGRDLGYDKDYIVSVQVPRDWTEAGVRHMETIRNEFARMPEVESASLTWQVLNGWDMGKLPLFKRGDDSARATATQLLATDEHFKEIFSIQMASGNFFRGSSDSATVVLNEKAATTMGWTANDAVGKEVMLPGNFPLRVIGVTKDFHFGSMKENIQPISFLHIDLSNSYRFLVFKLKSGNIDRSLQALQKKWSSLLPGAAFAYSFMDDTLANLYQSELQLKKATKAATFIVLVIVLMGVIGLVSLSVQKRIKEIGVRKILGASVYSIVSLFLKDFLLVFLIGGLISIPVSWVIMQSWLNSYAYRISLSSQPFMIPIISLAVITSIVITLQILRASLENPVKNLRTE